ncbi:CDP-diacylglycerol--glycerol-3-phosphate 3-phosphatidyltransferase protein, putative [Trichomonas vaginalis G3]|uniref:CDP-diacylglycerol--glycerol-3-phosphate 3-phosphatidyltransferase protein, putative n=1 Tax=Trichomonas vaginalis (strain ATCC PRA-98 / G3) TaxID=412133 RepID=A2DBM0_TRIV3|nr:cardiolipin synthase protein [Trichomonas vaginalis G3]EAY22223.1 CDP-diacylglycerol--glycerol-3-phosphate 3-phosphatidyltransferase protein, putative [Trichomonas vaginalis G3]KAI5533319.1 cardiolipin synthase protein [Trichomonas vaginalis G3]|eukprot:XP_001583209.1 CDP-diacylglycerol--glycerol-3-phosphate 3-phosphatidyltransferase protein [Trichomonas vaginalis
MVNIANAITLSRIPMLFMIVAFLYSKKPYSATIATIIFFFGAWTDWLDGYLARKLHICSSLGAFVDAVTDKIFMIGLFITMLLLNIVPHWTLFFIILILLREFLITALRAVAATRSIVIAAEKAGKIKTVIQMISSITLLIWFTLIKDYPDLVSSKILDYLHKLGIALFAIATFMTAFSGVKYIIDYRQVLADI